MEKEKPPRRMGWGRVVCGCVCGVCGLLGKEKVVEVFGEGKKFGKK